jgi:hypothetical protein
MVLGGMSKYSIRTRFVFSDYLYNAHDPQTSPRCSWLEPFEDIVEKKPKEALEVSWHVSALFVVVALAVLVIPLVVFYRFFIKDDDLNSTNTRREVAKF